MKPVEALPNEALEEIKPDGERAILAYGEVTGHAHALPAKSVKQYKAGSSGKEYVQVNEPSLLRHEEHSPISLPQGIYEKVIAREHIPGGERQVAD